MIELPGQLFGVFVRTKAKPLSTITSVDSSEALVGCLFFLIINENEGTLFKRLPILLQNPSHFPILHTLLSLIWSLCTSYHYPTRN